MTFEQFVEKWCPTRWIAEDIVNISHIDVKREFVLDLESLIEEEKSYENKD